MEIQSLHPEWDEMYRRGLPFGLIAKLCKAPRNTVDLHLQRQALLYPQLLEEHEHNRPPRLMKYQPVPKAWLERFQALEAFIRDHGRMPMTRGPEPGENALAGWLVAQRSQFRHGRISAEMLELLGTIKAWDVPARTTADRLRWQQRLADLQVFLDRERRWPRSRGYKSDEEHILGVWLHIQKRKHRYGDLPPAYAQALTDAAPGWDGNLRHYADSPRDGDSLTHKAPAAERDMA
jgi:Helicase associated domain